MRLLSVPSTEDERLADGEFVVVAGPDAGRVFPVPSGRALVGRAADCEFTVRDSDLEPHHLLIDVDRSGVAHLTQLAGRQPMLVDLKPMNTARIDTDGVHIELGATRFRWRRSGAAQIADRRADQPVLGYVDSGDRAFGIDAANHRRLPGHEVLLPSDVRRLCVVGAEVGSVVRAIVGQCVQAGWTVRSNFAGALCHVGAGARSLVVVDAEPSSAADHIPQDSTGNDDTGDTGDSGDNVDVVLRVIDGVTDGDDLDHAALGGDGSAIIVGERSRGRYIADINEFATTRLHLVGWHPATLAAACAAAVAAG